MKRRSIFLCCLTLILFSKGFAIDKDYSCGISYKVYGARFGDNLLSYLHAKWVSVKYDIPFLYSPFPYSEFLYLEREDKRLEPWVEKKYHNIWTLKKNMDLGEFLEQKGSKSNLYIIPYFPECDWEMKQVNNYPHFGVDWKDPLFLQEVKKQIRPKKKLHLVKVPEGTVNIALHIRTGAGFDDKEVIEAFPLKFPLLNFYIEQLKLVLKLMHSQFVYVHIFSDAFDVEALKNEIASHINTEGVIFGFRKEGNNWKSNVLEDFFSLTLFDVAIHGASNFAFCASILADYQLEIFPDSFLHEAGSIVIHQVKVRGNNQAICSEFIKLQIEKR